MTHFPSSRLFALVACAVAVLAAQGGAQAQGYPERPVRLIVPFQPGGPVDTTARIVSRLAENLRIGNSFAPVPQRANGSGKFRGGERCFSVTMAMLAAVESPCKRPYGK